MIGAGLALSSTAIVLPMLAERELLATRAGRDAFAVLLFQDLAFIPAGRAGAAARRRVGDVTDIASGQVWRDVGQGAAAIADHPRSAAAF